MSSILLHKNEEEKVAFMFYWEEFLAKVLGKKDWGSHMYYKTISEATNPKTHKPLCTPHDEAKAIVIWENNEKKWPEMYSFAQKGEKQPIKGGKYTTVDSGQNEHSAWDQAGLDSFADKKKKIKEAWADEHKDKIEALEKRTLGLLRKKKGLVCDSAGEQKKLSKANKRRAKNNLPAINPLKRKINSVLSDDEDD